jgi:O-antigen/teichoic acid export membrane protein
MIKKKISFGVVVGGLSIAVSSLSGLVIYPLLLKILSKEIAGLWFFYTSLTIIINLGQAGLAPIVMRRAAAASIDDGNAVLADFYTLIRKSYLIVSLLVLIICVVLYFSYVHWILIENNQLFNDGLISWLFFVAGNLITIYYSKNFYIINGFGEVGWDKVNQIIITTVTILGYFIVLSAGFGLIGLSVIFFIASIVYGISSKRLLSKFVPTEKIIKNGIATNKQILGLFKEGGQILVLNLVGILVMNKDIFFVERFLGLSILPSFSALSRIQGIVIAISMLIPQMIFPFISQSFAQKNFKKAKEMYWYGVIFSIGIAFILSGFLMIFAEIIFPLWLGEGNFLGNKVLFLLLLLGFLYIHHNAHASAVISTSENSFIWPALINALLSIPMAYLGIKHFGIEGMIIGNLIATFFPSVYVVNYSINYFNKLAKIKSIS